MRLINVDTLLFETFADERQLPPYAILSHTWSAEEVQYTEWRRYIQDSTVEHSSNSNFKKVHLALQQARAELLSYVWIDTCCIDKSSSAELTEAINSMYRWYEMASVCYVFLDDISFVNRQLEDEDQIRFGSCRWFTRGWTLQELIAPRTCVFYDQAWRRIAERGEILSLISRLTDIDPEVLCHRQPLSSVSIAAKMSWASRRQTTRLEDEAYCLLGIFGINMPMLYGEGRNAFARLQEEILRVSTDQSIFAWSGLEPQLLAPCPARFQSCSMIVPRDRTAVRSTYEMTNCGLRIALPIALTSDRRTVLLLDCADLRAPTSFLTLEVAMTSEDASAMQVEISPEHVLQHLEPDEQVQARNGKESCPGPRCRPADIVPHPLLLCRKAPNVRLDRVPMGLILPIRGGQVQIFLKDVHPPDRRSSPGDIITLWAEKTTVLRFDVWIKTSTARAFLPDGSPMLGTSPADWAHPTQIYILVETSSRSEQLRLHLTMLGIDTEHWIDLTFPRDPGPDHAVVTMGRPCSVLCGDQSAWHFRATLQKAPVADKFDGLLLGINGMYGAPKELRNNSSSPGLRKGFREKEADVLEFQEPESNETRWLRWAELVPRGWS